jgi:hypothetical protein
MSYLRQLLRERHERLMRMGIIPDRSAEASYQAPAEQVVATQLQAPDRPEQQAPATNRKERAAQTITESEQPDPLRGFSPLAFAVIKRCICKHYGITRDELVGVNRTDRLVRPRHMAMYLMREIIGQKASFPAIGRQLGNRDHTTVLHGYRSVASRLEADASFAEKVRALTAQCQQTLHENAERYREQARQD